MPNQTMQLVLVFLIPIALVIHPLAAGSKSKSRAAVVPGRCDDLLNLLQKATQCQNTTDSPSLDFNSSCSKKERLQRSVHCVNLTIADCSPSVQSFIKDYVNVHGQYRAALHVCRFPEAFVDARACLANNKRYVGFCEREQNYVLHEFRELQRDRSIDNLTDFTNQLLSVQCSALRKFIECLNRDFSYLCNEETTQMILKYNLLYLPHICYDSWAKQLERAVDEAIARRKASTQRTTQLYGTNKGAMRKSSAERRSLSASSSWTHSIDLFCVFSTLVLSIFCVL